MRSPARTPNHAKVHGVHYTPPELAQFLAEVTMAAHCASTQLRVLDPACGDGVLLFAIANAASEPTRRGMILEGYETDSSELAKANTKLGDLNVQDVVLHHRDFLQEEFGCFAQSRSRSGGEGPAERYDIVIANPPYVRTQVLGAERAQALARQFGLTGRIDLSHAFAVGMTAAIKPGGVLGLLTSNRFLTTRSGASLRSMFSTQFDVIAVYDLGDTKLFSAAVLPVLIVARKGQSRPESHCQFHRVYEHRDVPETVVTRRDSVLTALRENELSGVIETQAGRFRIQRGTLDARGDAWAMTTAETTRWLRAVTSNQVAAFGDLARVRVGIKSTADEVFVRDDWDGLPDQVRPEAELLRPLLTHLEAARWTPKPAQKRVLYPHRVSGGKRTAIDLVDFPKAAAYLERHRDRLTRRKYVIDGGRRWYELWVPHNPIDWARPKIAYPDISESPRFFFDASGAVIQGDCYWITLKDDIEHDWLLLMLAVANSTLITQYYDALFHNKLYAGRRRFMTQYVAKFPLPDLRTSISREIVAEVSRILDAGGATAADESRINRLVWEAFGSVET